MMMKSYYSKMKAEESEEELLPQDVLPEEEEIISY